MVRSEEIDEVIAAGFSKSDAILLGRRTYLEGAQIWPSLSGEMPMADFMNDTLKHVVSSTLDTPLGDGPMRP
jgi:dihydrofolate reductase